MMSRKVPDNPIVHLIEDDLATKDATELLLQTAGIEVRAYASAIHFLNAANPNDVQFLLIDVNMPGINGIDLLDRLRSAGITAPAIYTTGRSNTADLHAAAARTGAGILYKPYNPKELIARIRRTFDEG